MTLVLALWCLVALGVAFVALFACAVYFLAQLVIALRLVYLVLEKHLNQIRL